MSAVMSAAAIMLAGGSYVSAQDYDKSGYCPITKGMVLDYVVCAESDFCQRNASERYGSV